jgi:hypothetical protein
MCVVWIAFSAAKPSPGRPRRFAEAVGCADYPAVLAPMASSQTHFAPCGRSVQTVATKSVHVARFARWPWALRSSAPHRRIATCPGPSLRQRSRCSGRTATATASRQAALGRGDFCGDEEHSAAVGARSALRELTRRYCLNVAPVPQGLARSELSARPRHEHRSAVGAKRRPPQHEPLAGAAWRDAPIPEEAAVRLRRLRAATGLRCGRSRIGIRPRTRPCAARPRWCRSFRGTSARRHSAR